MDFPRHGFPTGFTIRHKATEGDLARDLFAAILDDSGVKPFATTVGGSIQAKDQKEICRVINDAGGDYFFTVKGNQPELKSDIASAFGRDSPLRGMVAAA